ncbi:MAG: ribose 1,5-bisphosphate isomerase [Candidatus Methanoplasma sp.]|nr:ribose 1,5-bisphosphate isomerase [Candidatus Methanoplasma sp.]
MFKTVKGTASDIKDMKIRGAGRIARAGASAMGTFAGNYRGGSLTEFRKDIDTAAKILLDSRPTAVSLWNGVRASTKDVGSASSLEEATESVVRNSAVFVEMSSSAVDQIAKIGAKRVQSGDTIMTHCNSSAAVGVIKEAHFQGKDIKVYATESRPWGQGLLTVKELSEAGIDVTLIIDSAVRSVMKRTDKVFVGADTVTSNGALINKIGTSQLALAADEARVQFNACTETYKFSPMTMFGDMVTIEERGHDEVVDPARLPKGVKIFNPVFDSTPAKYIDALITELGILSPGSVYDVMVRQLGEDIFRMRDDS